MKMLKKLAALVLAATMVLVLFTACSGDSGSTGTREPEKEKAAAHNAGGFVSLGILQTRDFKVMRQNFCLDCHDIAFYFGKLYVLDVVEPFIQ